MHALISGRAGKALLLDGGSLKSLDAEDPSKLVSQHPADFHYLFGESKDLRIIEDSDLESITREFKNDCDASLSLDLTLISLDGELPDDIRKEAIEGVDELLADNRVVEQLENILYARPVPEDADLDGALKLCDRAGSSRVLAVLKRLEEYQPSIREVCEAWDIIPVQIFGGYERQAEFQHAVVREGFFRAVVLTRITQAAISIFLQEADLNPYVKQLPNYRQVLQRWVAPYLSDHPKPPYNVEVWEEMPEGKRDAWNELISPLALRSQYEHTGRMEDLIAAIGAQRRALDYTAEDSADFPARLANLGKAIRARYELAGEVGDLDEALDLCRRAVEATDPSTRAWLGRQNNLAICLRLNYRHRGSVDYLNEAIKAFGEVLGRAAEGSPDFPGYASNYGVCLSERYSLTGSEQDLDEGLRVYRLAERSCPEESPDYCRYLNNLGEGLLLRYAQSGKRDDLEQALVIIERAVGCGGNSPDLPSFLSNLGHAYTARFELTGSLDDLNKAIDFARNAVGRTSERSPAKGSRLNNLGAALRYRFLRTHDSAYLDQAIDAFKTAVRLTQPAAPDYSRHLSNLGNCLYDRNLISASDDLDRAIEVYEAATNYSPKASPDHRAILSNLGMGLRQRYQRDHSAADLARCIEICRGLIDGMPAHSTQLAGYYNNFAVALGLRYLAEECADDLDATLDAYRRSVSYSLHTRPAYCLSTLGNWLRLVFAREAWAETEEIHGLVEEVTARLLHTQLLRGHKESWLHDTQGFGPKAAYALAKLGKAKQAVVVLETTQARLLSEVLTRNLIQLDRTENNPQDDLYKAYRKAADRFQYWSRMAAESETEVDGNTMKELRTAFETVNQTVDALRLVEPDFLHTTGLEDILKAADSAQVVYIAATELGGVALMVNPRANQTVTTVWLPRLADEYVQKAAVFHLRDSQSWLASQRENGQSASDRLEGFDALSHWLGEVMSALWDCLSEVGEVVLIPVGLLNLLPLHLAGTEKGRYVMDDWCIRFAPNALSLLHSDSGLVDRESCEKLLVVSKPVEDSGGLLIGAKAEAAAIVRYFPHAYPLPQAEATRKAIFGLLSEVDVVHFACHGHADLESPLSSGLALAGKERLTLDDLLKQPKKPFRLAVLSACETHLPGTKLPEEVVSLPAGFLQLGAAGVIGSQWAVSDLVTMLLMARFYYLWQQKEQLPAHALRNAQLWIRDSSPAEKTTFLYEVLPETEAKDMRRAMGMADHSHPFYWGAFIFTGV